MKNLHFAAVISLLSGCSLINSLDDVKPPADDGGPTSTGGKKPGTGGETDGGGGVHSGGMAGTAGKGAGGGGGAPMGGTAGMDAGSGGAEDGGTAGAGGTDAGTGGTDGGGGSTFMPGGPNGAIVYFEASSRRLFVLDPTDGHQVSSETSPVIQAIANDPATDYWYFFRQVGATTAFTSELVVRQLNTTTGQWMDIGKTLSPIGTPALPTIGVLNQRLVYLTVNPMDPSITTYTVLDTTKPEQQVTVPSGGRSRLLPAGNKVALLAYADTNPGGSASVALQQSGCPNTGCDVSLAAVQITGTTIKDLAPVSIGAVNPTGGSVGFAAGSNLNDIAVFPPLTSTAVMGCVQSTGFMGQVSVLNRTHDRVAGPFAFDTDNLRMTSAAFDPCNEIAFATSLLGNVAVWAIPLATGGTPQKVCGVAPGGAMFYEPYTKGLVKLTADNKSARFEIYDIDAKDPLTPKLTARILKLPSLQNGSSAIVAVRLKADACTM
jgi:hypothetical protein